MADVMEKEKVLSPVQAVQYRQQLEADFVGKEKKLSEELKAALERERVLVGQLSAARGQLSLVMIVAVLSVAAVFYYFKAMPKDVPQPVTSTPSAVVSSPAPIAVEAVAPASIVQALPVVSAPEVKAVPVSAVAVPAAGLKTGNGGNFSGGKTSQK